MTTALEFTAANAYQPWDIHQAGGAYAVYSAHSRVSASRSVSRAPESQPQQDTADISSASVLIAAAAAEPVARAEHLAALRQNIFNGTYSVSSFRIAGAVFQSLL